MTESIAAADYIQLAKESEIEQTIKDYVERWGGRCWHVRDSRRKDVTDMPDLLIVLPPVVALIETKSQRRTVTLGQQAVMAQLELCDEVVAGVVRPAPRVNEWSVEQLFRLFRDLGCET